MSLDPPKPAPALEKVIIAPDPPESGPPPSTPYRTTEAFEAIVALEALKRENERLRSARRRSQVGIVLGLAASCVSLAVFSAVLVVLHVPADVGTPHAVTCPSTAPELVTGAAAPLTELPDTEPPDTATADGPSALDELGGDEALHPLAKEIASALLADPVLRRNPRIAAIGSARLETAVRQSLISLFEATAEPDTLDTSELMWEIRPTHAEWAAAAAVLDKALEKHNVSEANRASVEATSAANEATAVDDTAMRATALARRASVGLSCPEESITSRSLETADARIVIGCGKRAIYEYVADTNTGMPAWHREPNP